MARTGDQLARRSLEVLNVVPKGHSPSPEDAEYCKDNWEELAQLLRLKDLFADDDDEIPVEIFSPLAYILAAQCSSRFGKSPPNTEWAYEALAIAIEVPSTGETTEMESY